jgi:hypothetical protein
VIAAWNFQSEVILLEHELLTIPGNKQERERQFDRAASTLWNTLPSSIQHEQSMGIFKKQLKTYLFRLAYVDFI